MAFECANHPGADAAWMCAGCDRVFCGDCITQKKFGRTLVETCKGCGELCSPVQGGITVEEVSLSESFGSAFAYPLRGSGPFILAGGTLFATVLEYLGAGFGSLIGWGVLLGYGMSVIRATADGRGSAPDWPDVSTLPELLRPMALAMATALVSFYPASWAADQGHQALSVGLLVAGALYAPMAWIAASVSGNFLAITPITVLPLLFRVNAGYWAACAVLLPLVAIGQLGMGALGGVLPGFLGLTITTGIAFFLLMVEMRILGLVWYRSRDELGLS